MKTPGRFSVILVFVCFLLATVSVWGQAGSGDGQVVVIFTGWILGAVLIALLAHHRFNRKWVGWLLISIFASPFFGVLALLIVGKKKTDIS